MRADPLPLITGKDDVETARRLVAIGYPRVAPILPFMLAWIQDCNWPVAEPLCPFFTSLGTAIFPEIRRVFSTNDDTWKYWCIGILQGMDPSILEEMRPDLTEFALHPTKSEEIECVQERAIEVLQKMDENK